MKYVCTWCGGDIREDDLPPLDQVSYGICRRCVGGGDSYPVDRVTDLDKPSADALPFGWILLDEEGTVVGYNRTEAEISGFDPAGVVGKRFFVDVAPCTSVRDFRGRFERLVAEGRTEIERFTFVFEFTGGSKLVRISMSFDATTGITAVLVSVIGNPDAEND